MLFLLFQIGAGRYAIEASRVVEVLPLMRLDPLPQAPGGIAGMLCYRGAPLPVADLSALILNRPAEQKLSTRILVVTCADASRIGLIAERANETFEREPADFIATGATRQGIPWLGPVTRDERGFITWIDPDRLPGQTPQRQAMEAA